MPDSKDTAAVHPNRRPARPSLAATLLACAVLASGFLPCAVLAQAWPQAKPVRIVVPFPPGGSTDALARVLAQRLGETFKQSFVVENRPGAGGTIGTALVAKSAPDGYTLALSSLAANVIAPVVQQQVPYDGLADFAHIALLGGPPTALLVHPSVEARDFKSFVALVKAKPGSIQYGTPGNGTHAHVLTELLKQLAGIDITHVPYKGTAPLASDLMAGHVPAASLTFAGTGQHIRAGKIRALASTAARRVPDHPDVPTFAELGFPQLTAITWFGVAAPTGLPAPIATALNAEVRKLTASSGFRERFGADGFEPNDLDLAAYQRFVRQETDRWQRVAREARIKAD
jgi:tripartite-type tricarboxylate transporter receptor subunit TctC